MDWCKLVTRPLIGAEAGLESRSHNNAIPGSSPGSTFVQTSFFLPDDLRDSVKEWCNTALGVKAQYPHGRWTYFPFYVIKGIPCIRVVLYFADDKLAFSLAWNGHILEHKDD